MKYRTGIEEGLRRPAELATQGQVKSSAEGIASNVGAAVPIAPPRRCPSPHTPNGTRVPSGMNVLFEGSRIG